MVRANTNAPTFHSNTIRTTTREDIKLKSNNVTEKNPIGNTIYTPLISHYTYETH